MGKMNVNLQLSTVFSNLQNNAFDYKSYEL